MITKKTHWKDDELMEKIELINNWKDTNWFHQIKRLIQR